MGAFLGSAALGRVLGDLPITCLDIGARSGLKGDLLPLAPAVDAHGFEPDAEECEAMNRSAREQGHPWRSLVFHPVAIGADSPARTLHLYRQRGCSSFLEPDHALVERFSRADYYEPAGEVTVATTPLDRAASEHGFEDAAYLKVDVEGLELEVLQGGNGLLERSLLAMRLEVRFLPVLDQGALFHEVDAFLRPFHFRPMAFIELRHWRETTKTRLPLFDDSNLPFSRGQLVHGDVLYFRDPASLPDGAEQEVEALLRSAFLALAHGYVDHALGALDRPEVREHLVERYALDVDTELGEVSHFLGRQYRLGQARAAAANLKAMASRRAGAELGRRVGRLRR